MTKEVVAMVNTIAKTLKVKTFSGLRRRVKSSSKVSSLSMTRRNLLRHRSTRFCFCFSTAMIKDKYRALNFSRGVK